MAETKDEVELDMEVEEEQREDCVHEGSGGEEMMDMFASVWVKTEVIEDDDNIEQDSLKDLNYEPPAIRNSATTRKSKRFNKMLRCDHCDYTTVYKNCLELHVLSHANIKPYQCTECDYKSKNPTSLNRHMTVYHNDKEKGKEPEFKCPFCDYSNLYKWNLYAHLRKHNNEKRFHCDHCEYASSYKHNFIKHMRVHSRTEEDKKKEAERRKKAAEKKEFIYKCDKCPFETKYLGHITRHLSKIHNEVVEKAKKCDLCDFSTLVGWRLNTHKQRSKQTVSIKCKYCAFETYYRCESRKHKTVHYQQIYKYKDANTSNVDSQTATENIESEDSKNETSNPTKICNNENINNIKEYKVNTNNYSSGNHRTCTEVNVETNVNQLNGFNSYSMNVNNVETYVNTPNTESKLNTNNTGTKDYPNMSENSYQSVQNYSDYTPNPYRSDISFADFNCTDMTSLYTDCNTDYIKNDTEKKNTEGFKKERSYLVDPNTEVEWNNIPVLETTDKINPFKCKYCHYSAKYKASIQRHYQRRHTSNNRRPYKCPNCEFSTKTKDQIALHTKRSRAESELKCNTCNYTTVYKCNYLEHQKIHNEFKCNVCDYSCRKKFDIQRHYLTSHLGAGIKCRFCDFQSTRRDSVLCHETKHTGIKPYKCELCSYSSVRNCLLEIHYKKFHSEVKKDIVVVPKSKIETLKVRMSADDTLKSQDISTNKDSDVNK